MRYARKVLYVDAVRYTGDNWSEIKEFVGFTPLGDVIPTHKFGPIQIRTPNGSVYAQSGDWVCRDTMGKYYPCSDDIFRQTYYVDGEIPIEVVEKMIPEDVKEMWKDAKYSDIPGEGEYDSKEQERQDAQGNGKTLP